jgi:hemerythrin-like domain-containing protein
VKRSEALAPLSRDHHHALVIASAMTRAGSGTADSSARLFADFILEHEARHFELEEVLLLPELPDDGEPAELAERVREDHEHLRAAARRFREPSTSPELDAVHAVGARLRAHVQLEERQLFPYLEQHLTPDRLDRIGAELGAREAT